MANEIGLVRCAPTDPASTRTSRISSVAYATDERASEENTASATVFDSRSWCAWARDIGAPTRTRLSGRMAQGRRRITTSTSSGDGRRAPDDLHDRARRAL